MPKVFMWCPGCERGFATRVKTNADLSITPPEVECGEHREPIPMEYLGPWPEGLEAMNERKRLAKERRRCRRKS